MVQLVYLDLGGIYVVFPMYEQIESAELVLYPADLTSLQMKLLLFHPVVSYFMKKLNKCTKHYF
jgi:hypothetical protein